MKEFEFTIIASGMDTDADDFEEKFFNAGCDDATIMVSKGKIILAFAREAKSFTRAIVTACRDVQKAGAKIEHIEPDDLVSESDIAERANISRAAVSLYAKGQRGADFPSPVARIATKSPLWDWLDVTRWMFRRGDIPRVMVIEAKIVRGLNMATRPQAVRASYHAKLVELANIYPEDESDRDTVTPAPNEKLEDLMRSKPTWEG